jgi:DnaJ-class molecular chaperone
MTLQATTADAFVRCKLAYEVLSDTEQRRQYDEAMAAAGGAADGGQVCTYLEHTCRGYPAHRVYLSPSMHPGWK